MAYNPHQHLTSHQHYQQQRQQQDLSAGSGGTLALLEASSSTTGLGGAPGAAAEYDAAAAMAAATAAAEEAKKNEPALRPFLCEVSKLFIALCQRDRELRRSDTAHRNAGRGTRDKSILTDVR